MSSATPTPALPPPSGTTSNFDHPASKEAAMDVAIGVAIPLTTIFFALRAYVRIWIKHQWTVEDCYRLGVALMVWIGTIDFCGTGAATVAHHGGEHQWDITRSQAHEAYYLRTQILAILFLYRRAFSNYPRSPFDNTGIGLIVLLVLFYAAATISKIYECIPRARIWDPSVRGHCIDMSMLLNVSGMWKVELTTGTLCVSFPELGVLVRGEWRRRSVKASRGIRERRYRQQDAVFNGVRQNLWTWTTSSNNNPAMMERSPGREAGWDGYGTTMTVTSDNGNHAGAGQYKHVELEEFNLIQLPPTTIIVEGGRLGQQNPWTSSGDVHVTRQIKMDATSMV
ncbi:hypothetical protein diail_10533 [Diaporthe ilicicola]|nr:hypothetical protein diail_10533 [Diaporthe ilicicola]